MYAPPPRKDAPLGSGRRTQRGGAKNSKRRGGQAQNTSVTRGTVGDPQKDTLDRALNIVMKPSGFTSLVFGMGEL